MTFVALSVISGALMVVAGAALSRNADVIADRTGLGAVWVGSVLVAGATSLPEIVTDVTAVRLAAPDLAVGDLFGSGMANMLILALIDRTAPRRQVLRRVTLDHALVACLAVVLSVSALLLVVLHSGRAALGYIPPSTVLLGMYIVGTRAVYRHSVRVRSGAEPPPVAARVAPSSRSLRGATIGFAVSALVIFVAAPLFALSAKKIAVMTGLGESFVGVWLVGLSTSMPEIVTTVAAVKLGALDLAVGNLFGSNAFNMAIFFLLDLASPTGSVFSSIGSIHVVSGLFAVMLTTLGLAAIVYRAERRFALVEPDALLIVVAYLIGLAVVGVHGVGR